MNGERRIAGTYRPGAPLELWHTGPPPATAGGISCLLDGRLHGLDRLERSLGLPAQLAPEAALAAAYARVGEKVLELLSGEFVVLLWHAGEGTGLIARDPIGTRPLFVCRSAAGVRFASEVCDLIDALPARPAPDEVAVERWLAGGLPNGVRTLYEGVERLEPGCFLRLTPDGADRVRYWTPRFREPEPLRRQEAAEELRHGVSRAIARKLDRGHTGLLLSGGLDSGVLLALALPRATAVGIPLSAYSAVFPDHPELDESALIALQAEWHGVRSVRHAVNGGEPLAAAFGFTRRWQLPPAPPGQFIWERLLAAAAADGVTCLLDGEGGDELFGEAAYLVADRVRHGNATGALRLARSYPGAGMAPGRRFLLEILRDFGLRPLLPRGLGGESAAWKGLPGPLWWRERVHALTVAPDAMGLFDYHRQRVAHLGILSSHPLLDPELIETVLALPPELAFDQVYTRPLLREAVHGLVPDEVRLRRGKSYFDNFLARCLAADLGAVRQLLTAPGAEIGAYADMDAVEARLEHSDRDVSWTRDVWRLLTLECWLRLQAGSNGPFSGLDPGEMADTLISEVHAARGLEG